MKKRATVSGWKNMKVLIDTNVVLDVLCNREQFYDDSAKVFKICEVGKIQGFLSALSIPNIVYIMRKELNGERIRQILGYLSMIFAISELTENDLMRAAQMDFKDYEDAVQVACASRLRVDYIVTRNEKDFLKSEIPVLSPSEFCRVLVNFSGGAW